MILQTGVPHFDSKWRIEETVRTKVTPMPGLISQPAHIAALMLGKPNEQAGKGISHLSEGRLGRGLNIFNRVALVTRIKGGIVIQETVHRVNR